jgi:hypothetical protein
VSVYLHPLGGRPLVWHAVRALVEAPTPPASVTVLYEEDHALDLGDVFPGVRFVPVAPGEGPAALRRALEGPGRVLLADAAAPLLGATTVSRLLKGGRGPVAVEALTQPGRNLVVAGEGSDLAALDDPWASGSASLVDAGSRTDALRITDRHALSEAATALRDRLVRRHEAAGVSFLLPATSWIDVDVDIGADTMIYPGCVLEGVTSIGAECVIGPHSRVVEATIGRGVELKGWNYVSRAAVRDHAILEAHERRAAD